MSKERLEEMENMLSDYYKNIDDPFASTDNAITIIENVGSIMDYAREQAERVQELERENQLLKGEKGINYALNDKAVEIIEEKEQQNERYRELLESISTTNKVASEIFSKKDGKTLIGPDDILQHILRKVNKGLEEREDA